MMADPLSVVGLTIGAVSLIIQITDECIKKYKYFTEAIQMPESYRYLRVRVQVEQQRFLSFAMEAGLLYDDGRICTTLRVNRVVLTNALIEINLLFKKYEEKNMKYESIIGQGNIPWDDRGEPQTDLMGMLCIGQINAARGNESAQNRPRFSLTRGIRQMSDRTATVAHKLRTIFTEPRRLIWVSVDQEEFEALVSKLKDLNTFLIGLLDIRHARDLEKTTELNYLELLQLRNDVKSLMSLIKALDVDNSDQTSRDSDGDNRRYLSNLARVKIRHIEIDQLQKTNAPPKLHMPTTMLLDYYSLRFSNGFDTVVRHKRWVASLENRSVWVEWVEQLHSGRAPVEYRMALLTKLLCEEKPPGFRAPRCLGYTRLPNHEDNLGFGIVFEKPVGKDMESNLITLRQLLGSRPMPAITERIALSSALADCLFSFHAIDWLHKGITSDNVIFFEARGASLSLDMPYITGYDFSRPSEVSELTAAPPFDPCSDIYRHPLAQFGEFRSYYRNSYDMYSLGIVLLEIALWKPIEHILGFESLTKIEPNELRNIGKQLLQLPRGDNEAADNTSPLIGSGFLLETAHSCSDSYRDIVKVCLGANEVEKPEYRGEPHISTKARLRTTFKYQVTDKLRLMKEALSGSDLYYS